jgi:hypothetical protein
MPSTSVWDLLTDQRGFYVGGEAVRIWENPEAPLRVGPEHFRSAVDAGDWVRAFNVVILLSALEREEEKSAPELPAVSPSPVPFDA